MTDMIDTTKQQATKKSKPPTQTAGVIGIDDHGAMGEGVKNQEINWQKLINLPAFEMFVFEESGQSGPNAKEWVENRRASMGDTSLYNLYITWHENKGLWPNETPLGEIKQGDSL